jgi:hypothetical protein
MLDMYMKTVCPSAPEQDGLQCFYDPVDILNHITYLQGRPAGRLFIEEKARFVQVVSGVIEGDRMLYQFPGRIIRVRFRSSRFLNTVPLPV